MSIRILGSVMCVSLFALATVTHAQNAPQTTGNSNVKVAQGTTQPGPAGAPVKTSKGKLKKGKGGKGTGSGGPESSAARARRRLGASRSRKVPITRRPRPPYLAPLSSCPIPALGGQDFGSRRLSAFGT